jgi:hypothetical protein
MNSESSESIDFALERIRSLKPDSSDEAFLLEIAWLYNRVIQSGSMVPVIDLSYELVWPKEFVAECVRNAFECGFIVFSRKQTKRAVISQKALRKLRQVGKQRV